MEISVLGLLIGSGVLYSLGYATAVMHRANSDYKKTKASLPGMRKAFWVALGTVIKAALLVLLGFAALVLLIWQTAKK